MKEDWEYEEVIDVLLGIEEEYDEIYAEEIERLMEKEK